MNKTIIFKIQPLLATIRSVLKKKMTQVNMCQVHISSIQSGKSPTLVDRSTSSWSFFLSLMVIEKLP